MKKIYIFDEDKEKGYRSDGTIENMDWLLFRAQAPMIKKNGVKIIIKKNKAFISRFGYDERGVFMYENLIKNIVSCSGGARERNVLKNKHVIKKSKTWSTEHKVLYVISTQIDASGHSDAFSVDIVTKTICG